jgi:hypothetical protein
VFVVHSDRMPDNLWVMEPAAETDREGRFTLEEPGDTLRVVAADPSDVLAPSSVVLLRADAEATLLLEPSSPRGPGV